MEPFRKEEIKLELPRGTSRNYLSIIDEGIIVGKTFYLEDEKSTYDKSSFWACSSLN